MARLFGLILHNALEAGILILAFIALRVCFKKIPKKIRCFMWGIAGMKLIIPIRIESSLSLVPGKEGIEEGLIRLREIPQGDGTRQTLEALTATNQVASSDLNIAAYVWILGVAALFAYTLVTYVLLRRKVATSRRIERNVFECDYIRDPFILGIVNPRIYVPSTLSGDAVDCVLRHERTHLQRRDYIWKPLGFVILCLYWFQPFCWISYILLCRDIEYACDEESAKDESDEWRAHYCQVLLNCSVSKKMISACPVAFGENSVKGRVKNMLNYKKPKCAITVLSIMLCAVVVVCFATSKKTGTDVEGENLAEIAAVSEKTKVDEVEVNQAEPVEFSENMDDYLHWENDRLMNEPVYDFGGFWAEARGCYFDGHYLFFVYDIVNNTDTLAITVNAKDEDVETVYYVSNGLDEEEMNEGETRIVMRAILYFEEYHEEAELVIGAKGSDEVYNCKIVSTSKPEEK